MSFIPTAERPILLVGAGRSGTNLIAMALGTSSELHNVYEQRYVWTHGMGRVTSDMRSPESATLATVGYIRRHFERQAQDLAEGVRLVDKTPANALRLDFCLRVFPEAKVINVIRNPFDNIASRIVELHKTGQEVEGGDTGGARDGRGAVLARRLRHFRDLVGRGNLPLDRIPAAVADQLPEKVRILTKGGAARYAERVPGLREVAEAAGPVAALCFQWRELVRAARQQGTALDPDRYLEVSYESLVQAPAETGQRITDFVGLAAPGSVIDYFTANARPETVGNWRRRLTPRQIDEIRTRLAPEIAWLGIDAHPTAAPTKPEAPAP
ncbi:hypothetical protein BMI91_05705 [Thioclava sediminum]|uniref:Sulfotransferase n=1 Tax=Thioclava sediminum TaxID=1915319 RepID=A0ABX3N1Q1_9RHOB|nr:sulfotransferase [Thioclava sediminum]OOY25882.1 hypothetical protein BMI91_05705 [Thioclava sediminum]